VAGQFPDGRGTTRNRFPTSYWTIRMAVLISCPRLRGRAHHALHFL
jgi:hypothetical protein